MASPKKRRIAAQFGDGHIRLVDGDVPDLKAGTIMVEVKASLVSPGTELGGWRRLKEKTENPIPDTEPRPFGYSNSGIVYEVGDGVTRFTKGDRVACIGGGYALHTDWAVVPHNLCVRLPDEVSFENASYAMLSATSLNALRRADLGFGECYGIAGLGILGQLAGQLHKLAGNYVIGWDTIPFRTKIAKNWGIHDTVTVGPEDPVKKSLSFTGSYGLDGGLIAFGGDASSAVRNLSRSLKKRPDGHPVGPIVVVGGANFSYADHEAGGLSNVDIRRAGRTGPGYHDEDWEYGQAYPPVVMRWTTTTNLELCMRLIVEKKLDVDALTTHTIPFAEIDEGICEAIQDPDSMLGVVFVHAD